MVSAWVSILIAVITAASTIGLNELVSFLRRRSEAKKLAADWSVTWSIKDSRLKTRIVIIENIGDIEAHNVDIAITGNSEFELHPDAPVNKCRPKDAILLMVSDAGTGVFKIDWTDAKGVNQGPVFRFTT
ncbi:hypothetical protein [Leucobacter aridicollis]|uniref:Uncharacterized protein n=1 Tax=Leucobacter aridicollis TaxID=283878 RepID=A0A852RH74_9MICO|nr:hypothetical protein [Leucobacter aridicollis]MBL3682613.1 hypothetical protein [Leucobacter aridicollis]NYD26032.1 hypothetical protein [Leucobacter aridicollis]